jgi:hypothetical protein
MRGLLGDSGVTKRILSSLSHWNTFQKGIGHVGHPELTAKGSTLSQGRAMAIDNVTTPINA